MADHSKPLITSTYANFVSELDSRFDDLTLGLDPAVTTPTNLPANAIRWNSASYKWEKWSGSAWADLSPYYNINLSGPLTLAANSASDALRITQTGAGNALVVEDSANPDSSPFVIDNAGRVLIGLPTARNIGVTPSFQLEGLGSSGSTLGISRDSADSGQPTIRLLKTRGTATGAWTAVQAGDSLGTVFFYGADGTGAVEAANISAFVDGTPGTNDMPGRLVFSTTADGASSPTERMRIDNAGNLGLGVTPSAWSGSVPRALQIGSATAIGSNTDGTTQYTNNGYFDGTGWKYLISGYSMRYAMNPTSGQHSWHTAPSGTAGNAITFTQAMTLDASGNLALGTSSPVSISGYTIETINNSTTGSGIYLQSAGTDRGRFLANSTAAYIGARNGLPLILESNATEAMRIDSSGNVGIGTSSPSDKLEVRGGGIVVGNNAESGTPVNLVVSNNGNQAADRGVAIDLNVPTTGYSDGLVGARITSAASAASGFGAYLSFATINTGGAIPERMRIDSSGHVGIGATALTNTSLRIQATVTGSTSSYGVYIDPTIGSGVTATAGLVWSSPLTQAAAFTVTDLIQFAANSVGLGAGSAVTNQYGFYSNLNATTASSTTYNFYGSATSATTGKTMYGLRLRVAAGTGTNYNLYLDGNANNYIEGYTSIGTTSSSGKLHVNNAVSGGNGFYVQTNDGYGVVADVGNSIPFYGTTSGLTSAFLLSTDATASGNYLQMYKDSASPANGDAVALIRMYGNDSTAAQTEFGRISTSATTVTNGSEQGAFDVRIMQAGALTTVLACNTTSDFRAIGAYNSTTASAANVFVGSTGQLSRSTSSGQYKTDVENLEPMRSEAIYQMRPVWYRSLCDLDNKAWSYYGFIAEEMAAIEPRLVHWGYADDQYELLEVEGKEDTTERVLKEDAVLQPEGVQYDRITVFLVEEMQKMKAEIDALKAEIQTLKGA